MAYAIIMVRSGIKSAEGVRDALRFLNLTRINHCVVVPENDSYKGMLRKVKDNVTWGEVSPDIVSRLLKERGRLERIDGDVIEFLKNSGFESIEKLSTEIAEDKLAVSRIKGLNPVFRLPPPAKGYEGIKRGYSRARPNKGGTLGYRGEAINSLLDRMLSNKDGVKKEKISNKPEKTPSKVSKEEKKTPAKKTKKKAASKKAAPVKKTKKEE